MQWVTRCYVQVRWMSSVRGLVQPAEVCLPLSLTRESHLPLGLRLLQLANLPPGEHLQSWFLIRHTNFLNPAVGGLHEGGEGEAQQGDGGLQEPVLQPSAQNSPAGCSWPPRGQATPGKKSTFAQSQNVSPPSISDWWESQNCEVDCEGSGNLAYSRTAPGINMTSVGLAYKMTLD